MAKWNEYGLKTGTSARDEVLILDSDTNTNKRITVGDIQEFANDKMLEKKNATLNTEAKNLIGAINEVDAKNDALEKDKKAIEAALENEKNERIAADSKEKSERQSEIDVERKRINNVYSNKLVTLDEIDLVTEEGFFVDALAVKELNSKLAETTADLSKANNSLGVIGTQYFGKTASYSYRNANNWVNNVAKVTLPKGTYIFTITAKPQALGQNLDAFTLGVTGVSLWEAQSTSLIYFGSGFYPTCTHTFVASVNADTYGLAIWSSHNRTVNDVEITATRIK